MNRCRQESVPGSGVNCRSGQPTAGMGRLHRMHKHLLGVRHDLRSLRVARRADYDGILVSDKFLVAAIAPLLLLRRKMKLLFWLTFPIPEVHLQTARDASARYPILTWMRGVLEGWLLYKWILPRSDHVFVQSERMKRDICAHGIDRAKVSPILTGFSPADILPVDRRHSAATTDCGDAGVPGDARRSAAPGDPGRYARAPAPGGNEGEIAAGGSRR